MQVVIQKKEYRLNDATNSLTAGTTMSLWSMAVNRWVGLFLYANVWEAYALWPMSGKTWTTVIICFLGIDMLYYWFHRHAHLVNLFWMGHVVHHTAEDFNLTTALRQGMFQQLCGWVYYLPLAVLGVPPNVMEYHRQWNTVNQFWFHTELIDRLPWWLEYVLNTPSHHRVHHARNPQYIDKNFAGVLIIWDRMFGTFEPEEEQAVYGITTPPTSWDPVATQTVHLRYMIELWSRAKGPWQKMEVLWRGPAWNPEGESHPLPKVSPSSVVKYDAKLPPYASFYYFLQYGSAVFLLLFIMEVQRELSNLALACILLFGLGTYCTIHALMDVRPIAPYLELARQGLWITWCLGVLGYFPSASSLVALVVSGLPASGAEILVSNAFAYGALVFSCTSALFVLFNMHLWTPASRRAQQKGGYNPVEHAKLNPGSAPVTAPEGWSGREIGREKTE